MVQNPLYQEQKHKGGSAEGGRENIIDEEKEHLYQTTHVHHHCGSFHPHFGSGHPENH